MIDYSHDNEFLNTTLSLCQKNFNEIPVFMFEYVPPYFNTWGKNVDDIWTHEKRKTLQISLTKYPNKMFCAKCLDALHKKYRVYESYWYGDYIKFVGLLDDDEFKEFVLPQQ